MRIALGVYDKRHHILLGRSDSVAFAREADLGTETADSPDVSALGPQRLLRIGNRSSRRYVDTDPVRFVGYWSDAPALAQKAAPECRRGRMAVIVA